MSKEKFYEGLLTSLLDCGYADLNILENCQYDIDEMKEILNNYEMEINLNNLAYAMFELGKRDIADFIHDRKLELDDIFDSEDNIEMFPELREEYVALGQLEPYDDIESFHNYIDTHIYIRDKEKDAIYKRYCQKALDYFKQMTGFSL